MSPRRESASPRAPKRRRPFQALPTNFQQLLRPGGSRRDRAAAALLTFMLRESVGYAARIDVARRRAAAAASGLTLLSRKAGRADAGLGQHEPHVIGRRKIAGDRCCDRADLLVAGEQQKGRRSAIALDADGVEAALWMPELSMPVRGHRPAGMNVRVDQGAERLGTLEPRIKIETKLACQRHVRTLSGGGDDPIHRPDLAQTIGRLAFDDDPIIYAAQGHDGEACDERRSAALHEFPRVRA